MVEQDRCHDINAWEPRRLGDVAEIGTGSHNTQDGHLAGAYPFFIRSDQKLFLDDFDYDEEAILIPGDGRIGQIYHYMNGKYALHQRVYRIKVDSSVDTRFILYLMESRFRKHALAMNSQGTVPSLRKPIFTEWGINLPRDRDEQVRIGMLFSQLDNLIAAEKRKLDLLQKKKTALLRQIFEQKLRFKGYNNPWEPRRLREIATVVGGGTPDTNNPLYWNGDINWFTPAEIGSNAYASKSERRITEEGLEHSSAKLLPAGRTILFTSRASIGLTAILTVDACTNQGFQSLVVSDRTDVFFLFGLCNQIKTQAIRNAAGSTFIEISGKQLAKIPLQIPSLDEQRRIGKVVRTMDSLIAVATRKIDLLTLKKKALLHQMFV